MAACERMGADAISRTLELPTAGLCVINAVTLAGERVDMMRWKKSQGTV